MPYTITQREALLAVKFTGVVTNSDFEGAISALRPIVAANPDIDELVDLTSVQDFEVSSAAIRDIAYHPLEFSSESRQAFVAHADHVFGMLRMLQIMLESERPNLMIFRSLESATTWLARLEEQTG